MTRFLSESLRASEPQFRQGLQRLEAANGHPAHDIRLSAKVIQATQAKLRQLGLDPRDTTAEELYHVLNERVRTDDARLTRRLRTTAASHISAEADVVAGLAHSLRQLAGQQQCFALKPAVLKTILKKLPPKKAMKQLGYRSLESCIKHEAPSLILAAAWLAESQAWQHQLTDQYKQLRPSDFESRPLAILRPDSKRWQTLGAQLVASRQQNVLSFRELGTIILLPLPASLPAGAVTASLCISLHELNGLRANSTFLKLCQVRPDFGRQVQIVARDEPHLSSALLDQPVPWHLIQRYYARLKGHFHEQLFEPHIRLEDMSWRSIEHSLSTIEPSLEFWKGTAHLGLLHNHQPVSLNIMDTALNSCNQLPFEQRLTQAFQRSLGHELLFGYLRDDSVEQTVRAQLQPQLATAMVAAA